MSRKILQRGSLSLALWLALAMAASAADDGTWVVQKSSGEVWISATNAQAVSLKQEDSLRPGDTVRTGRNGRVLLKRGEETILVSPNSVIGLPADKKDGLATTILQQAGSILLDVEKKNVPHFEVETPYLVAVVKGTQFTVTVSAKGTEVGVRRGQVAVSDFRSGQTALVMPGQAASSFAHGRLGLSLSGAGSFNAIENGKPRAPSIERIPVPRAGLPAPAIERGKPAQPAPSPASPGIRASVVPAATPAPQPQLGHGKALGVNVVRIPSAIGEVRLDVAKATRGLAHGGGETNIRGGARPAANAAAATATVWSESKPGAGAATTSGGSGAGSGVSGGNATGVGAPPAATTGAATASAPGKNGPPDDGPPGSDKGKGKNPAAGSGRPHGPPPGNPHGHGGGHGPPGGPPGRH